MAQSAKPPEQSETDGEGFSGDMLMDRLADVMMRLEQLAQDGHDGEGANSSTVEEAIRLVGDSDPSRNGTEK